jgi:hypothetical protein
MAIKELIPGAKDLLNLKSPKSWASLYLWAHYGLSLTVKDSEELVHAFKNFMKAPKDAFLKRQVRYGTAFTSEPHEAYGSITTRGNVKVDFQPRSYAAEYVKGMLFDTNLTLGNMWDLIPFSFVADLFLAVSTVLEQVDSRNQQYSYFSLNAITYSLKTTYSLPGSSLISSLEGDILVTRYDRWIERTLPPFQIGWKPPADPQRNWVEATALVVANL